MDAYDVQSESIHPKTNYPFINYANKPVMIYYFVDPFCCECWSIEKSIKKMTLTYGAFFNVRPIISHLFFSSDSCSDHRYPIDQMSAYQLSIGVKAATLQGNKAGRVFLRNVQDIIFLYGKIDSVDDVLLEAAARTPPLDINEFKKDLFSPSAEKAYKRDVELIQDMNVRHFPTLLFYSQYIEDHSVKISGLHSYETYDYVLKKMLQTNTDAARQKVPSLEVFLKNYKRVQTEEIAFIFELSIKDAETKLKKLQLQQKVNKVEHNGKSFWEFQD